MTLKIGSNVKLIPLRGGEPVVLRVTQVDLPNFSAELGLQGWLFRADENMELAVREVDRTLWEIAEP